MDRIVYGLTQLTPDGKGFINEIDILFISAGADYRAYEVLRKLKKSSKTVKQVIVIDFIERQNTEDSKYTTNYEAYKELTDFKFLEIKANIKDPSDCLKGLASHGVKLLDKDKIAIDISCFTKPYFFSFLRFFSKIVKLNSVDVFYTEPKSYKFITGQYDSYKSTSGPTKIKELFAGSDSKEQERLLLILLGFDGDISRGIDDEISPTHTMIVNGFPGYSPKFKDISLINNEKLVSNENNIKLLYSRANNPFDTYNLIDKIVREMDELKYINIAPLGTKPMALGACMYAIHNPSVRVIYPIPDLYENSTTDECWHSWNYRIPLK